MLFQFLRSRGLQDADAADLFQEVLRRVSNAIGKLDYEKKKGGFRAWLYTITRNCLKTHFEPKTWSAFELTAIENQSADTAAETLDMSRGAVYVARSRVTAKLQEEVKRLMEEMQ